LVSQLAAELDKYADNHKTIALQEYEKLKHTIFCSGKSGKLTTTLFGSFVDGTYTHMSDLDIAVLAIGDLDNRAYHFRKYVERYFPSIELGKPGSCSKNMLTGTSNGIKINIVFCTNITQHEILSNKIKMELAQKPNSVSTIRILKWFATLYIDRRFMERRIRPSLPGSYLYTCSYCKCFLQYDYSSLQSQVLKVCHFLSEIKKFAEPLGLKGITSDDYHINTSYGLREVEIAWEDLARCFRAFSVFLENDSLPPHMFHFTPNTSLQNRRCDLENNKEVKKREEVYKEEKRSNEQEEMKRRHEQEEIKRNHEQEEFRRYFEKINHKQEEEKINHKQEEEKRKYEQEEIDKGTGSSSDFDYREIPYYFCDSDDDKYSRGPFDNGTFDWSSDGLYNGYDDWEDYVTAHDL